ncbi:hypothetical protein GOBAR_DD13794 [Gossypium barbadense]|nr:hypothetical protein GOBAR_DD13794 [Gossypium barbadense]
MCSMKTSNSTINNSVGSFASVAYDSDADNMPLSKRIKHVACHFKTTGSPRVHNGDVRKRKFSIFAGRSKATTTLPFHGSSAGGQMNGGGGSESDRKRAAGSHKGIGKENKTRMAEGCKDASATTSGSIQKFGVELEGRLRRLEKMAREAQ